MASWQLLKNLEKPALRHLCVWCHQNSSHRDSKLHRLWAAWALLWVVLMPETGWRWGASAQKRPARPQGAQFSGATHCGYYRLVFVIFVGIFLRAWPMAHGTWSKATGDEIALVVEPCYTLIRNDTDRMRRYIYINAAKSLLDSHGCISKPPTNHDGLHQHLLICSHFFHTLSSNSWSFMSLSSAFIQPRNVQSTADGHGAAESCVSGSAGHGIYRGNYMIRKAGTVSRPQSSNKQQVVYGGLNQNHKNIAATGSKCGWLERESP